MLAHALIIGQVGDFFSCPLTISPMLV